MRFLMKNLINSLWLDKRAIAATEFALILPFLLFLLMGAHVVTGAMNHDRKVSRISSSVADLVAQAQTVTTGDLAAVLDLGETIMDPYDSSTLNIVVASVSFDGAGDPIVDWSYGLDGGSPWGSTPPITILPAIALPNTSVVISDTTLTYNAPFSGIVPGLDELDLQARHYLRPRVTGTIECTNC